MFARVVLLRRDITLDYRLPEDEEVLVGHRVLVPMGRQSIVGIVTEVMTSSDIEADKLRQIKQVLAPQVLISTTDWAVYRWCARYYHSSEYRLLRAFLPAKLATPWQDQRYFSAEKYTVDTPPKKKVSPAQQRCLTLLQATPLGIRDLKLLGVSKRTVLALTEASLIKKQQQTASYTRQDLPFSLNIEQQQAVDQVVLAQFDIHLLEGVTGSGKTAVYLHCMKAALQAGQQVLYMIPEIGLTEQTIQNIYRYVSSSYVVLHSQISDDERAEAWMAALRGEVDVVIGTRSSVLCGFQSLGLIIIDEEHDGSYKQNNQLRYHARDIAIMRAKEQQIPIILGSATPSLETYVNATHRRYLHHRLTARPQGSSLPIIHLLDMRQQPSIHGITHHVIQQTEAVLAQGKQVLFFLNRRGFAPVLMCKQCGHCQQCTHCDAHIVYHEVDQQRSAVCHVCGTTNLKALNRCQVCAHTELCKVGMGTQRLEQLLAQALPQAEVVRIDRDVSSISWHHTLESTAPKVLIGTQMIAKGHDFPHVNLVVIVNPDTALFSHDFRASEHLAQLLFQVSGRCGRRTDQGHVLMQTYQPQHAIYQAMVNHDYHAILKRLHSERLAAHFPPCYQMALLRTTGKNPQQGQDLLKKCYQILHKHPQAILYGPMPCAVAKSHNLYRWQLIVKAPTKHDLHQMLCTVSHYQPSLTIDINPYETL